MKNLIIYILCAFLVMAPTIQSWAVTTNSTVDTANRIGNDDKYQEFFGRVGKLIEEGGRYLMRQGWKGYTQISWRQRNDLLKISREIIKTGKTVIVNGKRIAKAAEIAPHVGWLATTAGNFAEGNYKGGLVQAVNGCARTVTLSLAAGAAGTSATVAAHAGVFYICGKIGAVGGSWAGPVGIAAGFVIGIGVAYVGGKIWDATLGKGANCLDQKFNDWKKEGLLGDAESIRISQQRAEEARNLRKILEIANKENFTPEELLKFKNCLCEGCGTMSGYYSPEYKGTLGYGDCRCDGSYNTYKKPLRMDKKTVYACINGIIRARYDKSQANFDEMHKETEAAYKKMLGLVKRENAKSVQNELQEVGQLIQKDETLEKAAKLFNAIKELLLKEDRDKTGDDLKSKLAEKADAKVTVGDLDSAVELAEMAAKVKDSDPEKDAAVAHLKKMRESWSNARSKLFPEIAKTIDNGNLTAAKSMLKDLATNMGKNHKYPHAVKDPKYVELKDKFKEKQTELEFVSVNKKYEDELVTTHKKIAVFKGELTDSNQEDIHTLRLPIGGVLSFKITAGPKLGFGYIHLLDTDNKKVLSNCTDSSKIWTSCFLRAGTYSLKVTKDSRNFYYGPYSVEVSIDTQKFANDRENNNNFTTARTLQINQPVTGHLGARGQMQDVDGVDYWKLTVPTDGRLSLYVTTSKELNLYGGVFIYDSNKNREYWSTQGPETNKTHKSKELKAGTYYIKIEKDGRNFYWGSYLLIVNHIPSESDDQSSGPYTLPHAQNPQISTDTPNSPNVPTVSTTGNDDDQIVAAGEIKTSTSYTPNCKGDVFRSGHWAGASGGSDWIEKNFTSPQLVTGIHIGQASTDITTDGFKLVLKLKKTDGTWVLVEELHNTNINRTELSGGAVGNSIPPYSKSLSPAIKATAFRLEFYGHGWFSATDIRIYSSDTNNQNNGNVSTPPRIDTPVKQNSGKPIRAGVGANRNPGKPAAKHNGSDSLKLIKKIFEPGERMELSFTASHLYPPKSWIGMFKAGEPHAGMAKANNHELSFKYLENKPGGNFTFTAPTEEGNYDFRMFERSNGRELLTLKFNVSVDKNAASLKLAKKIFEPGERMELSFTASHLYPPKSWIGMFKAGEPHAGMAKANNHELSFKYLENKPGGNFTFTAPTEEGNYDFRMFEKSNGKEVATTKFTVIIK